ncbi:MAG: porin family protein [Bacteroidota bacterium]
MICIKSQLVNLFCCLTFLAAAQQETQSRFEGAILGGFNVTQIDGDRLFGFNKYGLNGGLQVATILSERWQVSLEFSYSQRGSRRVRGDDPLSEFENIQLNYVEVPVMLRFLDWKLHFNAGLSYNRLINFEVLDRMEEDITAAQNYRLNNAAVVLGATYFINEHWGIDGRWSTTLLDLQIDNPTLVSWREKWLNLRLLYRF